MPDLTKREALAWRALEAMLKAPNYVGTSWTTRLIVREAFALADAMIAESEKGQPRND